MGGKGEERGGEGNGWEGRVGRGGASPQNSGSRTAPASSVAAVSASYNLLSIQRALSSLCFFVVVFSFHLWLAMFCPRSTSPWVCQHLLPSPSTGTLLCELSLNPDCSYCEISWRPYVRLLVEAILAGPGSYTSQRLPSSFSYPKITSGVWA